MRIRHQQLTLGQLQYQHDPSRGEVIQEAAALVQQGEIQAMNGADIEANVEPCRQSILATAQSHGHRLHQHAGHGDYHPALFRLGNKQVGADQAGTGMLPAHQHLGAHHLATAAGYQRLQIGHELLRPQRALQLPFHGSRPPQQPPHQQGDAQGKDQQHHDGEVPDLPQRPPYGREFETRIDG
ncbi:hypothetical protein D3C85_1326960 [compost metagenome]